MSDQSAAIVARNQQVNQAYLDQSQAGAQTLVKVVTFDLGTAQLSTSPKEVSFPFTSFAVITSTDSIANVNCRLESADSFNDAFAVKAPASLEFPHPIRKAFFDWSAQSGKTITIGFYSQGVFKTNQTSLSLSGGVNIRDGGSSVISQLTFVAATALSMAAANDSRKKIEFYNNMGQSLFIGPDNTITAGTGAATDGIEIPPGSTYEWTNNGPLWGITAGAGTLQILTHS